MKLQDVKKLGKVYKEGKNELWIIIDYKDFKNSIKTVLSSGINRVSSISGFDNGKDIEVIYHFVKDSFILNVKVFIPKSSDKIDTITDVFPSAILLEKELSEMLGIEIIGHPKPGKLLLPEDYKGKPPLRK